MGERASIREVLARAKYDPALVGGRIEILVRMGGSEADEELIVVDQRELRLAREAFSSPDTPLMPYHRVLSVRCGERLFDRERPELGFGLESTWLDQETPLPLAKLSQLSDWGIDLDPRAVSRLDLYFRMLSFWNRTHSLVSRRLSVEDRSQLVVDSLLPQLLVGVGFQRLLDVGSGGGLPGLPLAIAAPALTASLADPRAKAAAFLRAATEDLDLLNVTTMECSVQELPRGAFDWLVVRALNWRRHAAACARQLASGGALLSYERSGALRECPKGWQLVGTVRRGDTVVASWRPLTSASR
jgi:16S rRNA (guanine527-N7)-methyltransferase